MSKRKAKEQDLETTSTYFSLPIKKDDHIAPVFKRRFNGMDAYQRHQQLVQDYLHYYPSSITKQPKQLPKTDTDILKDHHK